MEFTKLQSRMSSASSSPSPSSSPLSLSSNSFIPPHKTQLHPRMHPLSLASTSSSSNPKSPNNPQKYLFLFVSLSVLPFLIYLFSLYRSIHLSTKFVPSNSNIFGLVIDVDDFRSQIRIFQSLNSGFRAPFGEGLDSMSVQPGFSGFVSDPERAKSVVLELIEFAKKRVPVSEWKKTKVQLRVSGDAEIADFHVKEKVLDKCRGVLRSSGLLFENDWASVLKGQDEGVYAWIALNYALGNLGGKPEETIGVVEIGGTSVQVSFAARDSLPQKFSRIIRLAGVTYNVYTQSLPQFGQDAAWKSLHELKKHQNLTLSPLDGETNKDNPCIPRGYEPASDASNLRFLKSHSAGNFSICRSKLLALLNARQGCSHPPCDFMSSFPGNIKLKADLQEGFFYTSKLVGMVPKVSLSELEITGHHFCEDVWDNLKTRHHNVAEMDLLRYCFSHVHMMTLLHDSFSIPADKERIGFAGDAGILPVDWTLGAFVFQAMAETLELEMMHNGDQIVGSESVTYFLLFAVLLGIVLLAAFFVMKLRRPQYKTIYDLEKGRYIVTRVPR